MLHDIFVGATVDYQIWDHYVYFVATWKFLFSENIEFNSNLLSEYLDKQE